MKITPKLHSSYSNTYSQQRQTNTYKLKWGDAYDGHGEMYYDYNHGPSYDHHDGGGYKHEAKLEPAPYHSVAVPVYKGGPPPPAPVGRR